MLLFRLVRRSVCLFRLAADRVFAIWSALQEPKDYHLISACQVKAGRADSCRRSVSFCIDLMKKQSGTLRLHLRVRRYADTSSFAVAALQLAAGAG
jgi:hypothetical protein